MTETNKPEQFLAKAAQYNRTAVWEDPTTTLSSQAWTQQVAAWGQVLAQKKVEPEQVVAVGLEPSLDVVAAVVALLQQGATVLLLSPSMPWSESARWMQAAGATAGILEESLATQFEASTHHLDWKWSLVRSELPHEAGQAFPALLEQVPSGGPAPHPSLWERGRVITLSAGTWKPPLGVVLSAEQLWASVDALATSWTSQVDEGTTGLLSLPLSATFLSLSLALISAGSAVVQAPPEASLADLAALARKHEDAVAFTTSHRLQLWTHDLERVENHLPLQWIWALGGPLSDSQRKAWTVPVRSAYKIEACGGIVSWAVDDQADCGLLLPGLRARVEPEDVFPPRRRKPGEPLQGEILLQGPRVSRQRLEVESRLVEVDAFVPGWLSTGDWGRIDRKQHLHIEGHVEDIVTYRDRQFSIRPIERKLRAHPQIEAAVLRSTAQRVPLKAYLETNPDTPGRALTSRTVLAYLQEHFPHYMHPKVIEIRDELPRNLYGEVARWKL